MQIHVCKLEIAYNEGALEKKAPKNLSTYIYCGTGIQHSIYNNNHKALILPFFF